MLALIAALLLPIPAHADSEVSCDSEAYKRPIKIGVASDHALDRVGSIVTFKGDGELSTVFVTKVLDASLDSRARTLTIKVVTLNDKGEVDQNSGIADVVFTYARAVFAPFRVAAGPGTIDFVKMPGATGGLRLLQHYDLTGCLGNL